jgi:hypothetical protein
MPNVDSPFGLRPVRYQSGAPYNGAVNAYSTLASDGTAIYIGDPVIISGTSSVIDGVYYQDVDQAATGDVIVGVVVAVDPVLGAGAGGRDSTRHRAASTQRVVYVADDPSLLFEIQEVSGGTALTEAAMGLNANFVVAAGSATTGQSGVELNNATEATTNTLDLQIVGFANRPGNEVGEHAKWLVRINRHQRANQVAGI